MPITVFFDIGDTLVGGSSWMPGARDCLGALSTAGLPLGLISNTGNLTRPQLAAGLPGDFSFDDFRPALVLLSSEVNVEKPDPAIFRLAVGRAAVPPEDCVFVGENLVETWAAQAVGLRALRVARFPQDLQGLARMLAG
ncbi:MAG: HAD family hydrolase [Kiloniellales bacterium]|nr:HAD family hydrolase [Kiloniellales bacterium]